MPSFRRQRSGRYLDGRNHHPIGRRCARSGNDARNDGADYQIARQDAASTQHRLRRRNGRTLSSLVLAWLCGCRWRGIDEGIAMSLSVALEISDRARRRAAVDRLKQIGGFLPTWSELADPTTAGNGRAPDLGRVDPDAPDVANLWRVHWFNGPDRKSRLAVPMHVVLPPELTGVKAPIVVLVGRNFPMIGAHKVLAAYA